ncbi:MAG: hypothetical protein ACRDLA_19170, partial [Thermoleophilaceae bacterium]
MERANRETDQPEDVAAPEAATVAGNAFDLDLSALDDDNCVPPVGLVVGSLAAGRHGDRPKLERGWERSSKEEPLAAAAVH